MSFSSDLLIMKLAEGLETLLMVLGHTFTYTTHIFWEKNFHEILKQVNHFALRQCVVFFYRFSCT